MPQIKANGIDLYYELHGEAGKPVVVLIAGLGYSMWMWNRMLPLLAKRCQVLAFDNRGVGQSARPAGPYSAGLLADDTAALMDALGIKKATVMGHSMGGFIAQAFALTYPAKVERLILSATNFGGPHHIPITPAAMAVLSDISGDPVARFKRGLAVSAAPGFAEREPQLIEEWVAYRLQNPIDPAAYQAQMAIGLGLLSEAACFEKRLAQIQAPTLILFGEHDQVVPPANAPLLAQQISSSQIVLLPNAGHFFPLETPQAAVEKIFSFCMEE